MANQDKMAGYATMFGVMLLTMAATMAFFLVRGFVPPFIVVILPAVVGAGLLAAGLVSKKDNGWTHNHSA
jgi:hypothetical protein